MFSYTRAALLEVGILCWPCLVAFLTGVNEYGNICSRRRKKKKKIQNMG